MEDINKALIARIKAMPVESLMAYSYTMPLISRICNVCGVTTMLVCMFLYSLPILLASALLVWFFSAFAVKADMIRHIVEGELAKSNIGK
jgi:hypothetical protein